mmetsp:Transcript_4950/g.9000  ORF Transcript_4950/g.9000 Transcript_4950/m.9000 type:complete len:236 (+) Transcript_4950:241-948(+)
MGVDDDEAFNIADAILVGGDDLEAVGGVPTGHSDDDDDDSDDNCDDDSDPGNSDDDDVVHRHSEASSILRHSAKRFKAADDAEAAAVIGVLNHDAHNHHPGSDGGVVGVGPVGAGSVEVGPHGVGSPGSLLSDSVKRCQCGRSQPSLGLPGERATEARWCALCPSKPKGAVNVRCKRCECGRSLPSFGLPGEERRAARWCAQCPHKPKAAVNVVRCMKPPTRPFFKRSNSLVNKC